jgi:hypothetical protein
MAAGTTYEPVAAYTVAGSNQASYTFNSVPATYTDLVLIFTGSQDGTYSGRNLYLQFNGDTGTNYSSVQMLADGGGGAYSGGDSNQVGCYGPLINSTGTTTGPSVATLNIQNYSNTSTYKTITCHGGSASVYSSGVNVGVYTGFNVATWRSTAAINSVKVNVFNGSFTVGSTVALYGIKAA